MTPAVAAAAFGCPTGAPLSSLSFSPVAAEVLAVSRRLQWAAGWWPPSPSCSRRPAVRPRCLGSPQLLSFFIPTWSSSPLRLPHWAIEWLSWAVPLAQQLACRDVRQTLSPPVTYSAIFLPFSPRPALAPATPLSSPTCAVPTPPPPAGALFLPNSCPPSLSSACLLGIFAPMSPCLRASSGHLHFLSPFSALISL